LLFAVLNTRAIHEPRGTFQCLQIWCAWKYVPIAWVWLATSWLVLMTYVHSKGGELRESVPQTERGSNERRSRGHASARRWCSWRSKLNLRAPGSSRCSPNYLQISVIEAAYRTVRQVYECQTEFDESMSTCDRSYLCWILDRACNFPLIAKQAQW
jgi:hypothetical protein